MTHCRWIAPDYLCPFMKMTMAQIRFHRGHPAWKMRNTRSSHPSFLFGPLVSCRRLGSHTAACATVTCLTLAARERTPWAGPRISFLDFWRSSKLVQMLLQM